MESIDLRSRVKGALYGTAVCDALGGPVEFQRRGSFPLVTTLLPNSNFEIPAGCWTDDTSMALCLAQSLIDSNGRFNVLDQIQKYIAWRRIGYMSSVPERGCFDIGISTQGTLKIWEDYLRQKPDVFDDPDSPEFAQTVTDCQMLVNVTYLRPVFCGNGSLMRIIPIGLAFHASDKARELAMESSKPTHPNSRCQEACAIYTQLVTGTLKGATKSGLAASFDGTNIVDSVLSSRFSRYRSLSDWQSTPSATIKSSGYVVDTLEAALWAFFTTETFRDGAIKVVNLGDDADTVGAVYGGLAGAWYGYDDIPNEWIEGLESKALLEGVVKGMCELAEKQSSEEGS